MSKKKLIPELRFPEFVNGEWSKERLTDISEVIVGISKFFIIYNFFLGLPLLQGNAKILKQIICTRIYTSEITKR